MGRKRSEPATLGDLEDLADSLKETFAPLGDLLSGDGKGKRKGPQAPKVRDDADDDDDDGDGDPDEGANRGPLRSVSKGWFGERAG